MPEGTRLANTQRLADRYLTERNWEIAERLGDFATSREHTLLELAFSWLLAQVPVASVIAGATKPEQIEQFAARYPHDARPTQALNGREVDATKD